MISITKKEYEKEFIQKGYEQFTEDQFRKWIDLNSEVLVKGEQGMLEDDIEKAEYEAFKEEIRSFTAVEVVEPSPISKFRIEKSIMYVRPKQVEWDEPEIIKGENGEDIQKARSGRYKDTRLNRKLGRVGNPYGSKKKEEESKDEHVITFKTPDGSVGERTIRIGNVSESKAISWAKEHIKGSDFKSKNSTEDKVKTEKKEEDFKIGDKIKLDDGFDKTGKPVVREYTFSKPGIGNRLKDGEFYLTSPGVIGFTASTKWLKENSKSEKDKGKPEKKEPMDRRQQYLEGKKIDRVEKEGEYVTIYHKNGETTSWEARSDKGKELLEKYGKKPSEKKR